MLRIAHVVSSLQIGGAERLVIDLACAQLRAGYAPWIVDLGQREAALAPVARSLGLRVTRVGHLRHWSARTVLLGALLAGRDHPVHIHNPWALRAVLPILPAVRGRVIYTRHGPSPYGARTWRLVHRLARPFIDHVTFVTDEARGSFESTHGASDSRHVVIGNGVAVLHHAPRRVPRGHVRLRIGSVGRLVELKGQRTVLDAIAKLPSEARARRDASVRRRARTRVARAVRAS
jgi:glycosyltransferase involved in cell wall biosynthesis